MSPEKMHFFFTQRLSQYCQIMFALGASTLLRERTGGCLGQPVFRGNTIAQVLFPRAGRADWAFSSRLVGWALCLGQTPLELTLLDLTRQIRTNAH